MRFACQSDEKNKQQLSHGKDVPTHIFLFFFISFREARVSKKRQMYFELANAGTQKVKETQYSRRFTLFYTPLPAN